MRLSIPLLGLATLSVLAGNVDAKTRYVELFGDNTANTECSKSSPCASIQHAIDNAAPNDRIVVGPGTYFDLIRITQPGIKLTSVAGAHGTVIMVSNTTLNPLGCSFGSAAVCIEDTAHKVTFGQKRKGFTVTGDFVPSSDAALFSAGDRSRIESNLFIDSDPATSTEGLILTGHQASVINNRIENFDTALFGDNELSDDLRYLVTGNQVINSLVSGIRLQEGLNSRTKVNNNQVDTCAAVGIYMNSGAADPAKKTGTKIQYNVIRNCNNCLEIGAGGNPDIKGNLADSCGAGLSSYDLQGASITNNLFQNLLLGIDHARNQQTRFTGNTLLNVSDTGLLIYDETASFKQAQKNNFINVHCPMSVHTSMDNDLLFKGNFWGDLGDPGPDLGDCTVTTQNAEGDYLFFNPSAKPNPLKYKEKL